MANDPVRVAAVGLGRWAKVLADAIKRSDRLRLVNCFSRSDKSRDVGSRVGYAGRPRQSCSRN